VENFPYKIFPYGKLSGKFSRKFWACKPKATRKRLKKEILSDDFKKRTIFWKNIAENFPYGKIFYGKFSTSSLYTV
jgi:hypothetical protein